MLVMTCPVTSILGYNAAAEDVAGAEVEVAAAVAVVSAAAEAVPDATLEGDEAGEDEAGATAIAVPEGSTAETEAEEAGVVAVTEAGGVGEGTVVGAGAAKTVAATVGGARADDAVRARRADEPEPWWAVLDSSTKEGVDGAVEPEEALEAFAMSVEVAGLRGDGQLLTELGDVSGGKGWRPSLVRLVDKGGMPEVQAVCVVSKARRKARSGKVFRMKALAVQKGLRGRGLAAEALKRLQVELGGWLRQITGWWPTWLPAWQRRVWASMPGKVGLVEMESGVGLEDIIEQRKQRKVADGGRGI